MVEVEEETGFYETLAAPLCQHRKNTCLGSVYDLLPSQIDAPEVELNY